MPRVNKFCRKQGHVQKRLHACLPKVCWMLFIFIFRPITLVVAKCWDPNPKGYFTIPRQEPVRPIDPSAWVAHTNALRNEFGGGPGAIPGRLPGPMSPSLSTVTSTSSSLTSSLPESESEYSQGIPKSTTLFFDSLTIFTFSPYTAFKLCFNFTIIPHVSLLICFVICCLFFLQGSII